MMKFLRSQSQTVLFIILVVIGVSFLFYGNVGNLLTGSGGRGNDFGQIDGQDVTVAELTEAVREVRDSLVMNGRSDQLNQDGGRAAMTQEAWRQLLLLHEADRLNIQISNDSLVDYLRHLPLFQKDGVYSPDLYQKQMSLLDSGLHISPEIFYGMVRNELRMNAVKQALFSTVRTSTRDLSAEYDKYFGPVQVTVVTLDPKTLAKAVQVSPAEVEAEYKAHPDNPDFRTPEKRKVSYVLFSLTPEQAKLSEKDKAAAIEAQGEKALDFDLALQPTPAADGQAVVAPTFVDEAKKRGLNVITTDFFPADAPPSGLPPSPGFNNAAFVLSKDNPTSKPVEMENGVGVLHLEDVQPSQLRSLEEVRPQIMAALGKTKAAQQTNVQAQFTAQILQAQVAKGTDFKAAAAAQKLTVQTLPPTVPAQVFQGRDIRTGTIMQAALQMAVGQVSQPVPLESDRSQVIIHLDSRVSADPKGLANFEMRISGREDEEVQNLVYEDWANWKSRQKGTHPPPGLEQYGGVE